MVDFNTNLGRAVATPQQAVSVIRPELRAAAYIGIGKRTAMIDGWLQHDGDMNIDEGSDDQLEDVLFGILKDTAMASIKDWAGDEGVVYDREAMTEFVRLSLLEAMSGQIDLALLDY